MCLKKGFSHRCRVPVNNETINALLNQDSEKYEHLLTENHCKLAAYYDFKNCLNLQLSSIGFKPVYLDYRIQMFLVVINRFLRLFQ